MPDSPDGQAASCWPIEGPDRQSTRCPANSPAGQQGNTGASQPATSRPAGWSASHAAAQEATSRRPARQPSRATTAGSHGAILNNSITKTTRSQENPGRKKMSEQPSHQAGRPVGQPAAPSQLALGQPASQMTLSRVTGQSGSQLTGRPLAAVGPAS